MLLSLTIIFLSALFLNYLFNLLKMPGLIGIMLTGILFGPYVFNFIPLEILKFPTDFKTLALIIILIRAGLSLNKSTLNKIGKNAVKLGIIPCLFEAAAIVAVAFLFLKIPIKEAAVLGFVIASVSPAVVIPQMLDLIDRKIGKNIPTLILAGASFDNVFALTLFSVFLKFSLSQHVVIYLKKDPL
jgi:NhaP-type Na+/H+ or K+/H+ antiporter